MIKDDHAHKDLVFKPLKPRVITIASVRKRNLKNKHDLTTLKFLFTYPLPEVRKMNELKLIFIW